MAEQRTKIPHGRESVASLNYWDFPDDKSTDAWTLIRNQIILCIFNVKKGEKPDAVVYTFGDEQIKTYGAQIDAFTTELCDSGYTTTLTLKSPYKLVVFPPVPRGEVHEFAL